MHISSVACACVRVSCVAPARDVRTKRERVCVYIIYATISSKYSLLEHNSANNGPTECQTPPSPRLPWTTQHTSPCWHEAEYATAYTIYVYLNSSWHSQIWTQKLPEEWKKENWEKQKASKKKKEIFFFLLLALSLCSWPVQTARIFSSFANHALNVPDLALARSTYNIYCRRRRHRRCLVLVSPRAFLAVLISSSWLWLQL